MYHKATVDQILQQNQPPMGTKRGRFLMRQPRIKRESDSSQPLDGDSACLHYLNVPHSARVERQYSDPLPTISPPPGNLLAVPGAVLVKQHSHPLLPSQVHQVSRFARSALLNMWLIQVGFQPLSPPLHIQLVPHAAAESSAERAVSPVVVVSNTPFGELPRADSAEMSYWGGLVEKWGAWWAWIMFHTAESATRPPAVAPMQNFKPCSLETGDVRSSHCPVSRPGPALGCNYCWNTVDDHGRILRRKTKYHCPECQTNLCIVPCFQEYHKRHSISQADPSALTSSVMKMFPKTSSM
ncbi:hypothetical protein HUJ04_008644 [Dendroctonus ponderosae]|nr:hypothetical protein HUJ04_008644 [Dendroctonus ponderosae]